MGYASAPRVALIVRYGIQMFLLILIIIITIAMTVTMIVPVTVATYNNHNKVFYRRVVDYDN